MKSKILISLSVGGILSALALYLAFRNVPFYDLMNYLSMINYWWLVPTVLAIVLTFVLRVLRWQLILKSVQPVPFGSAFHPLMIGFMMNCILPGRIGELARPVLLNKARQTPVVTGLATVAAERLFDIVLLIILFSAVFSNILEQPDLEIHFGSQTLNSQTLNSIAKGLIRFSLAVLVIIVLFAIPAVRRAIVRIIPAFFQLPFLGKTKFKPMAEKISQFSAKLLDNFAEGVSLISHPLRLAACSLLTVMIWTLTVFSYYIMSLGCPGVELSPWGWTTVMVIICFFIALPSVPGFWGLWEAGGVFALSLFGISAQEAAGFTLLNHAVQLFPVILIGLLSALFTSVNIFKVRYTDKALEPIV